MGRVRNALRALALTDPRPAAVLAGLDRLFTATELDEQVTTVAYLVVDPETGEGLAGNAGHLPPLLLSADAPPRLDTAEAGTPLGWASPRQQYAVPAAAGQHGGAVLRRPGGEPQARPGRGPGRAGGGGRAGAGRAWSRTRRRLLAYLVDRMLTGYEQDDDVTVLVLHVPARGTVQRRSARRAASRRGSRRGKGMRKAGSGGTRGCA